jgi:hypothetical protein
VRVTEAGMMVERTTLGGLNRRVDNPGGGEGSAKKQKAEKEEEKMMMKKKKKKKKKKSTSSSKSESESESRSKKKKKRKKRYATTKTDADRTKRHRSKKVELNERKRAFLDSLASMDPTIAVDEVKSEGDLTVTHACAIEVRESCEFKRCKGCGHQRGSCFYQRLCFHSSSPAGDYKMTIVKGRKRQRCMYCQHSAASKKPKINANGVVVITQADSLHQLQSELINSLFRDGFSVKQARETSYRSTGNIHACSDGGSNCGSRYIYIYIYGSL